jgi:hypothetical protein
MPFTLSHPAAAVPFARLQLPLSALIIGSMAPDYPYFIPQPLLTWLQDSVYQPLGVSFWRMFGHSAPGILWFCLPAGLLVLCVFHLLLKYPLLSLFPANHQQRLEPVARGFRFGPGSQFVRILLALLLGTLTHLAWDSFTHDNDWIVQMLPVLRMPLWHVGGGVLRVADMLQYGSSLLGIVLLAWWYWRWIQHAPPQPLTLPVQFSGKSQGVIIALMLFSTAGFVLLANQTHFPTEWHLKQLHWYLRQVVTLGITVFAVELLIYSLCWHVLACVKSRRVVGQ